MFIEDLIQFATGSGPWLFKHNSVVTGHDNTILSSLADQIAYNANQLTEKQGQLALRILNKYRIELRPHVSTIDTDLDDPQWKQPFRVLPKSKKIGVFDHKCIHVEFPYDNDLVEALRKRNSELHEFHKGTWDGEIKKWVFHLSEKSIEWLGSTLLSKEFQADAEFLELYKSVTEVLDNIENQMPMLVQRGDELMFQNNHHKIPQPQTTNLVEALFLARDHGITVWDDTVDQRINTELHPVTKTILSVGNRKYPWIDSNIHGVNVFADLINYGGPALVIVPGGSEYENVKHWSEYAESIGITKEQQSVMFRLPNGDALLNTYVRKEGLNNPVDENTRLVFVSTKITKPLIKAGIKFNTVINLGYYNYMHFTMSTVVDNARNLVYYSMKQPTKQTKWQPHEL